MSDLYIQRSNYYLSLSKQRIIIKNDNKEIVKEVSISLLDNVLLFGNAQLTTQLIKALSKNKVNVYYFSNVGQFISSIESHRQDEFQKQELQAKAYFEEDFRLEVARSIATTKVRHQIALLREFDKDGLLDTLIILGLKIASMIFRKLIPLLRLWVTKVGLQNPIFTI